MKRLTLAFVLPVSLLALLLPSFAAPAGKKKGAAPKNAEPSSAPSSAAIKPVVPMPTPAKPTVDVSSPWHTWSDPQGRTLEAAFCALQGSLCTVQSREGNIFQINLDLLSPADRIFAAAYARKLSENRLKDDYVKKAAYQIDFHIGSTLVANGQKFNPAIDDSQFVRRIYLDVVGRIPSADEAQQFLEDSAPDKRAKLIDALLESPGYTMSMYDWLADMLRVKDEIGRGAAAFLFQDWLKDQLAADRPWDAMVRDMLTADGKLCENGAAGLLLRDAQMPLDGVSNLLTTFLGANVACAQCHDHPLASWSQKDFYQMAAFFGATDGFDEQGLRALRAATTSGKKGGVSIDKVQARRIAGANVFRLVDQSKQTLTYPKDYKYDDAKPGAGVTPALISWDSANKASPAYRIDSSRPDKLRDEFAKWMTHPENPRFAAAIANRLWKKSFGLAVQEPVTDLDDPKKSFNPQLLAHLTQIMKAARFDLRQFQRVIFNSVTYQRRASPVPDLEKGPYLFPGPVMRRVTAEQAWNSILTTAVGTDIDKILLRRGEEMHLLALPGNRINAESLKYVAERLRTSGMSMGDFSSGKKSGGGSNTRIEAYDGLKPQQRFGLLLARASELPQPAPETHFLRLFGESDRLVADSGTTDGSVPQVLMLMNGPIAQLVADPKSNALAGAANSGKDPADRLYLSFLSRLPRPEEKTHVDAALKAGLSQGDLAWTLLNSREFLFIE